MRDAFIIEPEAQICVIRFTRVPSLEDCKAALDELARQNCYQLRLYDLREIGMTLPNEDLKAVAEYAKQIFTSPNRVAFVASDDLNFGKMRVLEVYREEQQQFVKTRVFRAMPEARQWLLDEGTTLQASTSGDSRPD